MLGLSFLLLFFLLPLLYEKDEKSCMSKFCSKAELVKRGDQLGGGGGADLIFTSNLH